MHAVTDATFDADVLHAARPVVVDFWAPWCAPCRAVEAIFEDLEREHGERVTFTKVNVDENPGAAARYGVLMLPTAILFDGGEVRGRVVGARSRGHYERAWAAWLHGR